MASFNSIAGYWALLPTIMLIEKPENAESPVYELKTSVVINQPPQIVWTHLVNFSQIPPPEEFIFRTGIAYTVDAVITGSGKGASKVQFYNREFC